MLNRAIIQGRITRDIELKTTQSGVSVTAFTLAVERDFKDKSSGEKAADFLDVVAWRNTAEFVSKYLTKGRMVVVEGRLQSRNYTDREGNKRKTVEIVADSVYFSDSKRDPLDAPAKMAEGLPASYEELSGDWTGLPF